MRPSRLARDLARDASLALRLLARRPGFAAVAILTLALGIGAPAAIFSVVQAVLLRPLPYPEPDRLVTFRMEGRGPAGPMGFDAVPASEAIEWAATTSTLSALSLYNERALTLSTADGPFRLTGISAMPNLFEVLGASAAIGRTFAGDLREVVLSDRVWRRFFGADPAVVGSSVVFDGESYLVTGVMPDAFRFPTPEADFWVPVQIDAGGSRGMVLPAVARLRGDATLPAVLTEGRERFARDDGAPVRLTLMAQTMHDQMVGGVRRLLWVLMAAVVLVFGVATANIALLLLTQGAGRQREFSVRFALGAGRMQLVRQLLVEGLTLAGVGGIAGLLLAALVLRVLVRLAPPGTPRLQDAQIDGGVLAFTLVLTLATSLLAGILSAGRSTAIDPVRAIGRLGGDVHATATRALRRRLSTIASAALALTVVLLVGAGLLLRSFIGSVLVDQGFHHQDALALQINLPSSRYPTPAARVALHDRLLERLRALEGVEIAGLTTALPNRQPSARFDFNTVGVPLFPDPMSIPVSDVRTVSEGFLEAMGVPLIAGRTFRAGDVTGAETVLVISERMAKLHFPDRPAVGELLYSMDGPRRVIGVVGDVRPAAPGVEPAPSAYLTMRQDDGVFRWYATATIVVRGPRVVGLVPALRTLLLSLDPEMPPFNVRPLADDVSNLVAGPRFSATVLGAFGAVALALAALGVYGVIAHSTQHRTQEIGVRMALGATGGQVVRLVLRDGVLIVAAGLAVGLTTAIWLARGLTGLLHEVTPADPVALGMVAAVLSAAGLTAAYLPARRATRISALAALRDH